MAAMNGVSAHRPTTHGGGDELDPDWYTVEMTSARPDTHTRSLPRRLRHWGPLGALFIITLIAISSIYLHNQLWPPESSIFAVLDILVFLMWNWLTISNLFEAAVVGPGYVPVKWQPDNASMCARLQYCAICDGYKAPRSHHCRICGRCVMKMDHHCPWINNCVGHMNHASFIRFLFYAVIGCLHASVILSHGLWYGVFRVWYMLHGTGDEPVIEFSIYALFACVFAFGLAVGVVCAVGFPLYTQLRVVHTNMTNVEDYICAKAAVRQERTVRYHRITVRPIHMQAPFVYPYDVGRGNNWRQVLWRSPVHCTHMNGFIWPVRRDCDQFTFTEEQLAQKAAKRDQARAYRCTHAYSGARVCSWSLLRTAGVRAIVGQPMVDGTRLPMVVGQHLAVTRAVKHWLYGELLPGQMFGCDSGDAPVVAGANVRGWFPRACAQRLEIVLEPDSDMPTTNEHSQTNDKKND